jgi:hypothetical protein
MTVRVGDTVLFKTRLSSLKFNQAQLAIAEHPAIVTRIHTDTFLDLTVICNGSLPQPKNGVFLSDENQNLDNWWELRK